MLKPAHQLWCSRLSLAIRKLYWTLWISLVLCATAFAAGDDPKAASVKLRNGSNLFSGTIVTPYEAPTGKRWFVLTCAHGFVGKIGGGCDVYVGSTKVTGTLRYHNKQDDVAVVELPAGDYPFVDVYQDKEVSSGTEAVTWGFPGGEGPLRITTTVAANRYVGQVSTVGQVKEGHSGGGLFIGNRLVAVTSARDPQSNRTLYCLPGAVHRAYHSVASGVVKAVGELFDCRNGRCVPRRPAPQPQPQPPPQNPPPQQGAQGPAGPAGPQGPPGKDGKSADMAAITASLTAWLEAHKDELRGPAGPQGPAGPAGKDGKPGRDGTSPTIDIDQLAVEVAKRMPATKPIYIGAKDYQGNVTMQAVAVEPGDTVYIRVQPPSLTASK